MPSLGIYLASAYQKIVKICCIGNILTTIIQQKKPQFLGTIDDKNWIF